ncbi:MAG: hypothetical protein IIY77_08525 [Lachnospiraceae bacterium]|nr:hypothetical protein [Lachnospiraceae bacterium]
MDVKVTGYDAGSFPAWFHNLTENGSPKLEILFMLADASGRPVMVRYNESFCRLFFRDKEILLSEKKEKPEFDKIIDPDRDGGLNAGLLSLDLSAFNASETGDYKISVPVIVEEKEAEITITAGISRLPKARKVPDEGTAFVNSAAKISAFCTGGLLAGRNTVIEKSNSPELFEKLETFFDGTWEKKENGAVSHLSDKLTFFDEKGAWCGEIYLGTGSDIEINGTVYRMKTSGEKRTLWTEIREILTENWRNSELPEFSQPDLTE